MRRRAQALSTGAAPERDPASVVGETDEPVAADEVEPAAIAEPAAEEPDQNRDDVAEFFAQAPRQEIRSAEVVSAPVRKLEPNSIADKLQRIRAVVSKSQPAPQTFSEDEHAEEILDEDKADNTILMADFFSKPDMAPDSDGSDEETGFAAGLATAETVAGDETGPDQQVMREDLADTVAEDGEYEGGEYDVAEDGDDEDDLADVAELDGDADDDADADLTATLARIGADFEDGDTPGAPVEEIAPSEEESDDADHGYDFSGLFADDEAADEDGAEPEAVVEATDVDATWQEPAVRARVIKVKRSEFRAAMDAGMLETDPAADSVADFDSDAPTAEVEIGELGAPETTADPSVGTFGSATDEDIRDGDGADMPDGLVRRYVATDEEELDRLMTEADQKMDDPDGNTRRAAFDQMRAAVDASKDDDDLSADEEDDDEAEYRTDFAEAVKPRRPMAGTRTDRPRDQRPAPLKLVAEQRVDLPTAKTGPVQPRRVAATAYPETVETEGGFAEYATTLGAHDLPDLLEAAASYLSFVEGRDQFSRPQLMTKVRQLDPEGFSREDGLRHFGQLLRAGKIEKIKGGRFTVSDDIGFRPDGKRATG